MKTLSFWKKSLYSALVFFGTVMVLSVGYAVWNNVMGQVSSGDALTAGKWNALVDNITDLNSRWSRVGSDIAFTGGNVGIGTASPGAKLEVGGDISFGNTNGRSIIFNTNSTNAYRIGGESGVFNFAGTSVVHRVAKGADYNQSGFMFTNDFNDPLLKIDSAGRVGIGTTGPSERLDLGGGNIKMGYEIVSQNGTTAVGTWANATAICPTGKQALGGACYQPSATCASCGLNFLQPAMLVTILIAMLLRHLQQGLLVQISVKLHKKIFQFYSNKNPLLAGDFYSFSTDFLTEKYQIVQRLSKTSRSQ